jgi:hypothetical protein
MPCTHPFSIQKMPSVIAAELSPKNTIHQGRENLADDHESPAIRTVRELDRSQISRPVKHAMQG